MAIAIGLLAQPEAHAQTADQSKELTIRQLQTAKEIADRRAAPGTVENIYWFQRAARAGFDASTLNQGAPIPTGDIFNLYSRSEVRRAFELQPFVWRPRGSVPPGRYRETIALIANGWCTGTVVGKNAVLTAAHCLCELGPSVPVVVEGVPTELTGAPVRNRLPDCAAYVRGSEQQKRDLLKTHGDMAVLRLDRDVSTFNVAPAKLGGAMVSGTFYTIVGYGRTDNSPRTPGKKMEGRIVAATCTSTDEVRRGCRPNAELLGVGEIETADGRRTDACSGDSGGPVFLVNEQTPPHLAGVISRPIDDANCGEGSIYGSLDDNAIEWIREGIREAERKS